MPLISVMLWKRVSRGPIPLLKRARGIITIIIALWILSGWRIRIPAGIAAFMLVGIVLFNLPSFPVLFRDLSIAAMAVALVFLEGRYTNAHTELLARNQY